LEFDETDDAVFCRPGSTDRSGYGAADRFEDGVNQACERDDGGPRVVVAVCLGVLLETNVLITLVLNGMVVMPRWPRQAMAGMVEKSANGTLLNEIAGTRPAMTEGPPRVLPRFSSPKGYFKLAPVKSTAIFATNVEPHQFVPAPPGLMGVTLLMPVAFCALVKALQSPLLRFVS
jgi:hypothetical protein